MTKHIQIELSDGTVKELETLREFLNLPSIGEVIRSSIAVNRYLLKEKAKGNDLILRNKKTNDERIIISLK